MDMRLTVGVKIRLFRVTARVSVRVRVSVR